MNNNAKTVDFFMGANSATGFSTYYDELCDTSIFKRSYLIKGGAGSGKSSLLRRVATECEDSFVELLHCSSDPNSLDGVILKDKRINMCDATPPHVIEPKYPGGYQTVVNFCDFFDEEQMAKGLDQTVELQEANNACHKKCCRLLAGASLLLADNQAIVATNTNFEKIEKTAHRIAKKELKKQPTKGVLHKRLLSAITNQGIKTYYSTALTLSNRIYLIKDEYGVASTKLLSILQQRAVALGYEVYACYCPMDQQNRIEHLFIPALSLGFVTSNSYVTFDYKVLVPTSVISFTRFTNTKALKLRKLFLSFNRSMASKLIKSAVDTLAVAKQIHDDLEKQYTPAVDFVALTKKCDEVVAKINKV